MTDVDPLVLLNAALEGRSQTELAEKIGCTQQYLNKVLHGHKRPGPAILKYLGLTRRVIHERAEERV